MDRRLSFIVNVEERAENKSNLLTRLNEQTEQALRRIKLGLNK
jgi:hypothetical protein